MGKTSVFISKGPERLKTRMKEKVLFEEGRTQLVSAKKPGQVSVGQNRLRPSWEKGRVNPSRKTKKEPQREREEKKGADTFPEGVEKAGKPPGPDSVVTRGDHEGPEKERHFRKQQKGNSQKKFIRTHHNGCAQARGDLELAAGRTCLDRGGGIKKKGLPRRRHDWAYGKRIARSSKRNEKSNTSPWNYLKTQQTGIKKIGETARVVFHLRSGLSGRTRPKKEDFWTTCEVESLGSE